MLQMGLVPDSPEKHEVGASLSADEGRTCFTSLFICPRGEGDGTHLLLLNVLC